MKLLKTVLIFFLPIYAMAQSNYESGYVVTERGDTLRGFIDNRRWESNPDAVSFKKDINAADHQRFTIADIVSFHVGDFASYRKYTVSVSKDITDMSHIQGSRDTTFEMETVFLKILQKGKNV